MLIKRGTFPYKEKSLSYSDKMHMFMYMYISMHNSIERECPFSIMKDTYPASLYTCTLFVS